MPLLLFVSDRTNRNYALARLHEQSNGLATSPPHPPMEAELALEFENELRMSAIRLTFRQTYEPGQNPKGSAGYKRHPDFDLQPFSCRLRHRTPVPLPT